MGHIEKKEIYKYEPSFKMQAKTLPGKQAGYNLNLGQVRQG
jgi:hypothetical protein